MARARAVAVEFGAGLLIIATIGWVAYRNTAASIDIAHQLRGFKPTLKLS